MEPKKRRMTVYKTVAEAARDGCFKEVRRLIDNGHPVDVSDNRGWRPTHDAAHGNHLDCLKLLLENEDTDVNHQSFDGLSSLMVATKAGHPEAMRMLIQHGAQPDLHDFMNNTPIMEATNNGDTDCVKILLESNPDVNKANYCGSTALHLAASKGRANITKLLLDHGASLDVREDYNITPIFNAAHHGQPECLKLLLEFAKKRDQLHLLNTQADDGATGMFLAAQEGHVTCLQLLLDYGADANIVTNEVPALPLHAALQLGEIECLDLLLPVTNPEKFRDCDMSPWQFALEDESGRLTQRLVDHGIDVNYSHSISNTDLDLGMSRYLYRIGTYATHASPLTLLSSYGLFVNNADILFKAGAIVNPKSAREFHPLLPALDNANQELVELLIDHGSVVNIYCNRTFENLTMLICTRNWKLVTLMLKCGGEVKSLLSGRHCETISMTSQQGIISSSDSDNEDISSCCTDSDDDSEQGIDQGLFMPDHQGNVGMDRTDQINYYFRSQLFQVRYEAPESSQTRVIRFLLQFVGNIRLHPDILELCRSHLIDLQHIEEITGNPRDLRHLCRLVIRDQFTPKQLMHEVDLRTLHLPDTLKDYICYVDIPCEQTLKY